MDVSIIDSHYSRNNSKVIDYMKTHYEVIYCLFYLFHQSYLFIYHFYVIGSIRYVLLITWADPEFFFSEEVIAIAEYPSV